MVAQVISLGGNNYDVYVVVAQADLYLSADVKRAAKWLALSVDSKKMAIITAVRRLDRLRWIGDVTVQGQPLDWPRTGAADCDGVAILSSVVPTEIDDATILLAADISAKPSLGDDTSTDTNLKRAVAGPVEVEFFKTEGGLVLPNNIFELVSCLLDGSATGALAVDTGTDVSPHTGNNDFCRTGGFA